MRLKMIPQLLLWIANISIGQSPPGKPAQTKKEAPADHKVVYIGRGDYEPVGNRVALGVSLTADGAIVGDGKFVADNAMIKKWMTDYCTGYERVSICIGVQDPAKTTIRTMDEAISRLEKHIPKGTRATFYVSDGG
jgi:hypothetical protein